MQTVTLFATQDISPLIQPKETNVLHRAQNYETTLAEYGLSPADALVEKFVLEETEKKIMTWVSDKVRLPDEDCRALVTDGQYVTLADWTHPPP